MKRKVHKPRTSPWIVCAAIVVLSTLVGVWHADDPNAPLPLRVADSEPSTIEQIESTLAQAGCPGWMVLASEGESALQPLPAVVPDEVQPTVHRVSANIPTVEYPSPIRVANRLMQAPPSGTSAKLTTGAATDPDDLLDGVPDLLADPSQPAEESPSDEPSDEPTDEQPIALPPTDEPMSVEQPPIEEPPAEDFSAEDYSADEPPIELPTTQPEAEAAQPPAPPKSTTESSAQEFTLPELTLPTEQPSEPQRPKTEPWPKSTPSPQNLPTPKPTAPRNEAFAPPQPPTTKQREAIPAPQPTAPLTTPAPPVQQPVAPATTPKTQSPFAAPPKPTQPTPHSTNSSAGADKKDDKEPQTYCEFVAEQQYPSAQACAKCHEKIYDEWSVSSHAYASISPMFHKFEQTINTLSQGTVGYFCYRCHVPVGTTLGVSRATPLWDLPQVAREGVTCIACHRVNQRYGKVNGHRRIEPGNIHDPVYGSIGGDGVAQVIAEKNKYKVKTSPHEKGPGQDIHVVGQRFDQLGKSEFCVSCHQVAVHPGIKLEVVWEQYRASPACKKGVSCQDCHMGRIPGVKSGYEYGAAAEVNGKVVNKQRKHANHVFYGPGYSIAHPGIFPHNIDANRWSMQEWLLFDWRAGWGTDEFEELVDDGRIHVNFPKVWQEADDRYDAREIIEDNQKKLDYKRISRQQTMENGSHVDGPFFDSQLMRGQELKFHYIMTNTNDGHNLPSGSLGAQPQLWANVVLIGPRGQRLWESGYTDRYGDVADIHSEDVRNKLLPFDWQLFNLQTMFLITGAKGTDREFFLPVNFDFDQLPYLRPGAQPISVLNHPPFIRMEGRSLSPLGSRKIPYKVPGELMCEPGHYRLSFRLRSRAEPIYFMRFCGSTQEMNRAMNEGMIDFHQSSIEFLVR